MPKEIKLPKVTKALVKEQLLWTDNCFRKALLDVHGAYLSKKEKRMSVSKLKAIITHDWREAYRTPESNAAYIRHVLKLDSKKLSIILHVCQEGRCNRHPETIEAIMTELFERAANSETREKHG